MIEEELYSCFPPELEEEVQNQYIMKLSNGDQEAREEARKILIIHNTRLAMFIAKKFIESGKQLGVELDDLISVSYIGLIKAIDHFDVNREIKLATFISKCVENEIGMYLKKLKRHKYCISLEESLDQNLDNLKFIDVISSNNCLEDEIVEPAFFNYWFPKLFNELNEREKKIIAYHFGFFGKKAMVQEEIAAILGLSQSYVARIEKKILKRWRKEILFLQDECIDNHDSSIRKKRKEKIMMRIY